MRISGERTYIIPFEEKHLTDPKYFQWLTDLEVMKYIGREEYLRPIRFQAVRDYVEGVWNNSYCSFFALYALEGEEFIGTMKLSYGDQQGMITRTIDVGIMIGARQHWGKGYATDSLGALCRYAFDVLGARKLVAGGLAANVGIIKAFNKVGFIQEGVIRRRVLVCGEYIDHVLLGCFKDELISNDHHE